AHLPAAGGRAVLGVKHHQPLGRRSLRVRLLAQQRGKKQRARGEPGGPQQGAAIEPSALIGHGITLGRTAKSGLFTQATNISRTSPPEALSASDIACTR